MGAKTNQVTHRRAEKIQTCDKFFKWAVGSSPERETEESAEWRLANDLFYLMAI